MDTVSQAKFAEMVGVSRNVVWKGIQSGRLRPPAVTHDKRIVAAFALEQWGANRDPRADLKPEAEQPRLPAAVDDGETDGYRAARQRAAEIDAERKQIELDRLKGDILDRASVERAMVTAGRRIRQALDRLPGLADELAALGGDVPAVRALMRERVRALETTIAESLAGDAGG